MKENGFTLIELMITVAIIAILASIAYPSYQDSVRKTRRAAAQADLMKLASFMERTFTTSNSYASAALPALGTEHYNVGFSAGQPTTITFVLQAAATGSQTADTTCGTMTVSNTGLTTPTTNCW
jgi:type IV pilus assembly protein PilE